MLSALLGACTPTPTATQAPATAAPPSSVATEAARPAGKAPPKQIIFAQTTDARTLDPSISIDHHVYHMQLSDPLVYRQRDLKIEPHPRGLAEKWETTNSTTWRFSLRKQVKFTNGEEMTADGFKLSLDRIRDKQTSEVASNFSSIADTKAVDPHTLEIITKAPDPILLPTLANSVFPLPVKYFEEKKPEGFSQQPIGVGPYVLKEWVKGDHLAFTARPDYRLGASKIETYVVRPVPEPFTRAAAMMNGEADIAVDFPPQQIAAAKQSGKADVAAADAAFHIYFGLNGQKFAPFKDQRVRLAMNYAVNKEAIVTRLLGGLGVVSGQPVPVSCFGHNANVKPYPYDPERAKALLKEAGYEQGFKITIDAPIGGTISGLDQIAVAIAGDLKSVGVQAEVATSEFGVFVQQKVLKPENFSEGYVIFNGTQSFDGHGLIGVSLATGAQYNYNKYSDPTVNDLIKKESESLDQTERKGAFDRVAQLVHDQAPWVFLYYPKVPWGVRKGLDWTPRPDRQVVLYNDFQ